MKIIDYSKVKERLNEFNKRISIKSSPADSLINIKLDKYENLKNNDIKDSLYYDTLYNSRDDVLILCLYYNNICVSSITCTCNEESISISSKTNILYTGKKYNILLRTILILIVNLIKINNKKCNKLKSYAINPISEESLKKYFIIDKKDEYMYEIICGKQNKKKANNLFDNLIDVIKK